METAAARTFRAFFTAFEMRDVDAALSTVAPEVQVSIYPLAVRDAGVVPLRELLERTARAFPDLKLTLRSVVDADPVVAVEFKLEGTQADDYLGAINQEKHLDVDHGWRFTVVGERIARVDAYWCQNQLYRRLAVKRLDQVAIV